MNVEEFGSGAPLLLVHGLGADSTTWAPLRDGLGAAHRCFAIDLPGHGATPPLAGALTFARVCDEVERFLRERELTGSHLVGASVGGRVVLELARRGLGDRVVALGPGGFWNVAERAYLGGSLAASIRLLRTLRPWLPRLLRSNTFKALLLLQFSQRGGSLPYDQVWGEFQSMFKCSSFDALLRALVRGPVQQGGPTSGRMTIGWGRQDRLLLPRQAREAQRQFPQARLHWFEACGHYPHWDRPDECLELILNSLSA